MLRPKRYNKEKCLEIQIRIEPNLEEELWRRYKRETKQ